MKRLNSNNVSVNSTNMSTKPDAINNTSNFNPNDCTYDALDVLFNIYDPIDSKGIINLVNTVSILGSGDNSITSGSIILEIKRLIIRAARNSGSKDDDANLDLILHSMHRIETCVERIVDTRKDDMNYYRSIILYNIKALFDIYNIDSDTKDGTKLVAFINYFVDVFTKTLKQNVD